MPRLSNHVTLAQAENFTKATGFARQIGLPLNRFVTILWEHPPIVGRVQDVQGRVFERMHKWLRYRGVDAAYVWVLERGSELGLHTHFLVHVPSEHLTEFRRMLRQWLDGRVEKETINVKSISYRSGGSDSGSDALNRVKRLVRYLLKGVCERSGALLGIVPVYQGRIMGKRAGTSQNIGAAAREKFGRDAAAKRVCARTEPVLPTMHHSDCREIAPASVLADLHDISLDIPDFLRRS